MFNINLIRRLFGVLCLIFVVPSIIDILLWLFSTWLSGAISFLCDVNPTDPNGFSGPQGFYLLKLIREFIVLSSPIVFSLGGVVSLSEDFRKYTGTNKYYLLYITALVCMYFIIRFWLMLILPHSILLSVFFFH